MSVIDLRQVKHDLRTPINHLVGYSELALETAVEEEDQIAEPAFRRLVETSRSIATLADKVFGEASYESADDLLNRFQQILTPQLKTIATLAAESERALVEGDYSNDLQRIRIAAERLQNLDVQPKRDVPIASVERKRPALRERILVVDDDADNRDLLTRMLVSDGYQCASAQDGLEALAILEKEPIDLVLLDILMPGMTGHQVFEKMKSAPALRGIPVVMVSALAELTEVVKCIRDGAEDYIQKPFQPVLLRARIEASLTKRRLQRQLSAQERLASLGSLSAGVAHEIRNPLNFVVNFAELSLALLEEIAEQPTASVLAPDIELLQDNIQKVLQHAHRADHIIHAMLSHSRVGTGCKECIDLNKLVSDSAALARDGERGKTVADEVSVELILDPNLPAIEAFPSDLQRGFLNLISNALQAAHKTAGGQVTIITGTYSRGVEVRIKDNGPGIPLELREKIFEPFFTTKDPGKGTGLGLSITNDIITNVHGGEIAVESELGQYAEFIVRLPQL